MVREVCNPDAQIHVGGGMCINGAYHKTALPPGHYTKTTGQERKPPFLMQAVPTIWPGPLHFVLAFCSPFWYI